MSRVRNQAEAASSGPHTRTAAPVRSKAMRLLARLLEPAGVELDGPRPWDMHIHDARTVGRILARGSLGLGESYMDGGWDCESLDDFFFRVLRAGLERRVGRLIVGLRRLRALLFNLQNTGRVWRVGRVHYDIGNDFFAAMLDARMTYSCGYWARANNLDDAQAAKLDLICRKLGLRAGMRLLDIGCGWGSLMKFAARHYGVSCVGLTISKEQADFAVSHMNGLPVEFRLADYREFNPDGSEKFERVASVGMFEHVGHKNYGAFFDSVRRSLVDDGLLLLHTIGKNDRQRGTDPWIDRYIFPNGELPSLGEMVDASEGRLAIEDVHNFGADYDRTLMAWYERFEASWPDFAPVYGERFYRMWRYYLLSCAGAFRARKLQLWQAVLSPHGVLGGYRRPE